MRNKTPHLRYKGFDNDWVQYKVDDVATRYDNLRIPVAANLRVHGDTPYYGANGIQDYVDGYTHDGEFVLVAEDGANDLKDYPVRFVNGHIWVNNHAHVLQGKNSLADNKFLTFSIKRADIESLIVGGSRAKLNAETLMEIEIFLPNVAEQIKIGNLINQIDCLITYHQYKYDKLVDVKKSLLDKMFPAEGQSVPRIRFKGYSDTWGRCELSEIAEKTYGGGTPSTSNADFWDGDIPWFQSSDIEEGKITVDKSNKHISRFGLSHSAAQLIPGKSIAIVTRVGVGKIAYIPFSYATSQDFLSLCNLNTDPIFTAYACYKKINSELGKVQGTSIKGITKDELLAKVIYVPSIQEQSKIGSCIQSIDNLITLQQQAIEKLNNIKKSLLERMFV